MLKITPCDQSERQKVLDGIRNRSAETDEKVTVAVKVFINNVVANGDKALREYSLQFDGACPEHFEVPKEELQAALANADPDLRSALENAAKNIESFHQNQKQRSFIVTGEDGTITGQRLRPLNTVGMYVPCGTSALSSTVLMNAIPAKIAGVKELIMCTPPQRDGKANPDILLAAAIAGVDKVFACGSAWAIAAMAYGTQSIPRVDKIVGPGNIYVATAKKLLFGRVDIDMIAGPSEILIMADKTANPKYIAADILSQAEHDVLASAVLLTTDEDIAQNVITELDRQIKQLPRREIAEQSLADYGAILRCEDEDDMVALANELAPEHLEVMCANAMEYLGRLDNAGSVFLGDWSPEPLGDYYAGPNHVLPTSGTARFFSPLGVDSFIKRSSFISYNRAALEKAKEDIITIAGHEGLDAHANAVKVRFE